MSKRLSGAALVDFLRGIQIERIDPIGRMSASGEGMDERELTELMRRGDRVYPTSGRIAEDPLTVATLFEQHKGDVCFGLTPDGHLHSHAPLYFDAVRATQQMIEVLEADIAVDDREEAVTAIWAITGFHNHDHPADMGCLIYGANGKEGCKYLDAKVTYSSDPGAQRAKLNQRACDRKLGLLAQTVTKVCDGGFRGYPGYGQPGLIATLLSNPYYEGRPHKGYAINWFFHIASNYQAGAAAWGWGGPLGYKLPDPLCQILEARKVKLNKEKTNFLYLLRDFRNYYQFRDSDGVWDQIRLKATLEAKAIAARYFFMHEDVIQHAQTSVANLQPNGVTTPIELEEFHPGDSLVSHFGRMCDDALAKLATASSERDAAVNERNSAVNERNSAVNERNSAVNERNAAVKERNIVVKERDTVVKERDTVVKERDTAVNERDVATLLLQQSVARRRGRGHDDSEIAEDMGLTLADFLQRYPRP